ncbi:hypothetical protein BBP40_012181, partial [Aspergillus hancockii]
MPPLILPFLLWTIIVLLHPGFSQNTHNTQTTTLFYSQANGYAYTSADSQNQTVLSAEIGPIRSILPRLNKDKFNHNMHDLNNDLKSDNTTTGTVPHSHPTLTRIFSHLDKRHGALLKKRFRPLSNSTLALTTIIPRSSRAKNTPIPTASASVTLVIGDSFPPSNYPGARRSSFETKAPVLVETSSDGVIDSGSAVMSWESVTSSVELGLEPLGSPSTSASEVPGEEPTSTRVVVVSSTVGGAVVTGA